MRCEPSCFSKFALGVLILATLFSLWCFAALLDPSPEAKGVVGGLGTCFVCFVAPFWVLYRGRLPFLGALLLVPIVVLAAVLANMLAWTHVEPQYTHFSHYNGIQWWTIPGLVYVLMRTLAARVSCPSEAD